MGAPGSGAAIASDLFPPPGFSGANGFRNGKSNQGDRIQGLRGRDVQGLDRNHIDLFQGMARKC